MNILFIFTFQMDLSLRVLSEYDYGSHKVYLNFWVTHFGGCDRVQIKVNISVFGWECPSPWSVLTLPSTGMSIHSKGDVPLDAFTAVPINSSTRKGLCKSLHPWLRHFHPHFPHCYESLNANLRLVLLTRVSKWNSHPNATIVYRGTVNFVVR
jgi:hypothetical protein